MQNCRYEYRSPERRRTGSRRGEASRRETAYRRRKNRSEVYYQKKRKRKRSRWLRGILSVIRNIAFMVVLVFAIYKFSGWASLEGMSAGKLLFAAENLFSSGSAPDSGNLPVEESTESGESTAQESIVQEESKIQETSMVREESAVAEKSPVQEEVSQKENTSEKEKPFQTPAETYDYAKPVPASEPVSNDYFSDAVFIGDSRTEGFITNTGLTNTVSYTHKGLMVDTVFTKPVIRQRGEMVSIMDALKTTKFNKVYIMLGINEMGWPYSDVFIKRYGEIIDGVRTVNPDAVIYVEEILPVSNKVSAEHSYIKNSKISEFNRLLQKMAAEKQVYYIDLGKVVAAEDGSLPEDAAADGIHLKKAYCVKWLDYLKSHTAVQ